MSDVVESAPRRGWAWGAVAVVAGAALVVGALRDGSPDPSPTPTPPLEISPEPVPRLSAPAGGETFGTVLVADSRVLINGSVAYLAPQDHRVMSFTRTRTGWAAVVVDEAGGPATPTRLVVNASGTERSIVVDEGTVLFAGVTEDTFWTTRPEGPTRRRDLDGDVVATERIPLPWRAVGATVGGLLLETEYGPMVGLWRRGRVELLARDAGNAAATPTHAAWASRLCDGGGCDVTVRDMRDGTSWQVNVPGRHPAGLRVNGRGDMVLSRESYSSGWAVYLSPRGEATFEIATSPPYTQGQTHLDADWIDDDRIAVFDLGDDTRTFAYDIGTRTLTAADAYDVSHVNAVLAEPA